MSAVQDFYAPHIYDIIICLLQKSEPGRDEMQT